MVENKLSIVINEIRKIHPYIVELYTEDELMDVVNFLWRLGEIEYEAQVSARKS